MPFGRLAYCAGEIELPLEVLQSHAGFYIGTRAYDDVVGGMMPFTRESIEYWPTQAQADEALADGKWTQKLSL